MKMLKLLILLMIIFSFSACTYFQPFREDFSRMGTRHVKVGDQIDLNLEELKESYNFDDISVDFAYGSLTLKLFMFNDKNELFAMHPGVSDLSVYLSRNNKVIALVHYGLVTIYNPYDADDSTWEALNSFTFYNTINSNPSGKYYLEEDIDVSVGIINQSTGYFNGCLVNPFGFKIINLNRTGSASNGLFHTIDHAYIDGLIIEDASLTGDLDLINSASIGILANKTLGSYITNITITGNIRNFRSEMIGGIVGESNGSYYRSISFEGEIYGYAQYIGGLFGTFSRYTNKNTPIPTMIENAYVIGNLESIKVGANVQAFIGHVSDLDEALPSIHIYNGYFDGGIKPNDLPTVHYFTFSNYSNLGYVTYMNLYTTQVINTTETALDGDVSILNFIDHEMLVSGEELEGMDGFNFMSGEYPSLKGWIEP